MDDLRPDRTAITTLTAVGSVLGHHGGDYLVQPDWCARHKQQRTRTGRTALAVHAATYALTQAVTKAVFYRVARVRVPAIAQLAGAVVEGVLHAVIDDGRLLARFADVTGKIAPTPEECTQANIVMALIEFEGDLHGSRSSWALCEPDPRSRTLSPTAVRWSRRTTSTSPTSS